MEEHSNSRPTHVLRDWILEENLFPFLTIVSGFCDYEFDVDDRLAVEMGIKSTDVEADRWFDYEFSGHEVRIARDIGSMVVCVSIDAPSQITAKAEVAIEIAKGYRILDYERNVWA